MRLLMIAALGCGFALPSFISPSFISSSWANDVAPAGTLRAVYLGSNPGQAVRDPATGVVRGASYDLAQELGKRLGVTVDFKPLASPAAVIEVVGGGQADIGFVAYEPSRAGTVEFSQTYMLAQQSFVVPAGSAIKAMADIDRPGQKIAGVRNDSISLYLRRHLKQATLVEVENDPAATTRMLNAKEIDAFGASRQRLTALAAAAPEMRLLPDNLFGVPQTIIVPKGKAAALVAVNRFIDEVRASGFLKSVVERSGIAGLEAAPGGSWQPTAP